MGYDSERIKRGCPLGGHIVQGIDESSSSSSGSGDDGTLAGKIEALETDVGTLDGKVEALETDVGTLEGRIDALETALAAILEATGDDSGKFAKIDSEGKLILSES